ncbi:hypothetical protein DFH06DRAFT_1209869 [Mycena polygramma]|nr:hypothetical protein DFH06DRAFT_1209869 [Mycena polygramma]
MDDGSTSRPPAQPPWPSHPREPSILKAAQSHRTNAGAAPPTPTQNPTSSRMQYYAKRGRRGPRVCSCSYRARILWSSHLGRHWRLRRMRQRQRGRHRRWRKIQRERHQQWKARHDGAAAEARGGLYELRGTWVSMGIGGKNGKGDEGRHALGGTGSHPCRPCSCGEGERDRPSSGSIKPELATKQSAIRPRRCALTTHQPRITPKDARI